MRTTGTHTTGKAVKNHISPKMARELIAINLTMYHSQSLVYQRVPLRRTPKIQYPKEVEVRVRSYGETRCINQQKPKTKIEMKDAKKYQAIYHMNCLIGCRSSERIWSINVVFQSHRETLSLDIETLPVRLMILQWSREQKWNQVRVSIVSTRTFRRTQIATSA